MEPTPKLNAQFNSFYRRDKFEKWVVVRLALSEPVARVGGPTGGYAHFVVQRLWHTWCETIDQRETRSELDSESYDHPLRAHPAFSDLESKRVIVPGTFIDPEPGEAVSLARTREKSFANGSSVKITVGATLPDPATITEDAQRIIRQAFPDGKPPYL